MNKEKTNHINYEYKKNHNRRIAELGAAALGILVAGGTLVGTLNYMNTAEAKRGETLGNINTSISEVDLSAGANIREYPVVPNDNDPSNIVEVAKSDLDIKTPDGIREFKSATNGEWYGISEKDIDKSTEDGSKVVWVNEQMAAPEDKTNNEK